MRKEEEMLAATAKTRAVEEMNSLDEATETAPELS